MQPQPRPRIGRRAALGKFVAAVRRDFGIVQHYRKKYHNEEIALHRLPLDVVRTLMAEALRGR